MRFFILFLYICCGDFVFSIRFLISGIIALSLADIVGKYFLFLQICFLRRKRGPQHYRKFWYISMQNLQKQVADLSSSQKNTQFEKKKSFETESGKSRY
jgi:hypothetical protein